MRDARAHLGKAALIDHSRLDFQRVGRILNGDNSKPTCWHTSEFAYA